MSEVTFSWFVYSQIRDDGRILLLHCILKFILIKAKSPFTRKKQKWKNPSTHEMILAVFNTSTIPWQYSTLEHFKPWNGIGIIITGNDLGSIQHLTIPSLILPHERSWYSYFPRKESSLINTNVPPNSLLWPKLQDLRLVDTP